MTLAQSSAVPFSPDRSRGLSGQALDETTYLVVARESAFVGDRFEREIAVAQHVTHMEAPQPFDLFLRTAPEDRLEPLAQ